LHIKNNVSQHVFKKFLLELSAKTLYHFNPFGKINSQTVNSIVKNELIRKDKIKFFSFIDNELIAYSYLIKFEKPSKKHNCILGIVVADKWQKKGFGRKICEHMICHAWKKNFSKIWLTVFADNRNGLNLYKSLGFEIEGIFMDDEIIHKKKRTVISMAIFKNSSINYQKRKQIWKQLEKNI